MNDERPIYQARAVTVMDAETGLVLYENSQHQHMYPASVTKVMTALLVLEEVSDLSQEVMVSDRAVYLPHYAARLGLSAGDSMTVHEALYGLMLPSGNDIANALAEHVSGSVEAFVSHMNRRAAELGAVNTRFVNPCGLPGDGQHVTAYDMSLIMREAVTHPVFNEIIAAPQFYIGPMASMPYGLLVPNTNLMVHPESYHYHPDVVGGKTGFTFAASHTLVSYARRGEHSVIVTVLYSPRHVTFSDTASLLDYAFSLPIEQIFDAEAHYWEVPVIQDIDGEATEIATLRVEAREGVRIPVPTDMQAISTEVHMDDYIQPPIFAGSIVGRKFIYVGNEQIAEIELFSTSSVLPYIPPPPVREISTTPMMMFQQFAVQSPFFSIAIPLTIVILVGMLMGLIRRRRRLRLRRMRRMERAARHGNFAGD